VLANNVIGGAPNFYPETGPGNYQLTLSYPNPGIFEITTAGTEQEQASALDCATSWIGGTPFGSPQCSPITTIPVAGTFDPAGAPQLFVTAEPAATATPEPASIALAGIGLMVSRVGPAATPNNNQRDC
jgi:hypothetical protein